MSAPSGVIEMAGDWIKMRTALANDPAVIAIALDLDKSEFEVVGMLHHLWSWADSQSQDGHIKRVTEKWIDRYVHCQGFAKSMVDAGWLVIETDGITFPNFDRHNGESAKKRAEATERKRISRENRKPKNVTDLSQDSCDKSETREEKRREEEKIKSSCDSPGEPRDEKPEPRIDYASILKSFQERLPALPQPRDLTDTRKKKIRSIVKRGGKYAQPDFFDRYFKYVSESDFLMGRTAKPWNGCCIDWLINPTNFQKIVEGNYHKDQANA